jgi:hypothetical protein
VDAQKSVMKEIVLMERERKMNWDGRMSREVLSTGFQLCSIIKCVDKIINETIFISG